MKLFYYSGACRRWAVVLAEAGLNSRTAGSTEGTRSGDRRQYWAMRAFTHGGVQYRRNWRGVWNANAID